MTQEHKRLELKSQSGDLACPSSVGVPCASHTKTFANLGKEASTCKPTPGTDSNMGLSWCLCYIDITGLVNKGNVAVVQIFHCCYQSKWGETLVRFD